MSGLGGRNSLKQQLSRMDTASKSQIMYMTRMKELFGEHHPELVDYIEVMESVFAQWLDMVDMLRKHI